MNMHASYTPEAREAARAKVKAQSFWTPERALRAAELWAEGLSASKIGHELGTTRNAVIGFSHRNRANFPARKVGEKVYNRPSRSASNTIMLWPQMPRLKRKPPTILPSVPPPPNSVPFAEIKRNQCQYIAVTEDKHGPSSPCCGGKTVPGKSWCGYHYQLVYRPVAA